MANNVMLRMHTECGFAEDEYPAEGKLLIVDVTTGALVLAESYGQGVMNCVTYDSVDMTKVSTYFEIMELY